MRLRDVLLGTAFAVASGGAAQAAIVTPTGWYLSLAAGPNWVEDAKAVEETGAPKSTFTFDTGYAVAAAVGYDFGDHWRAELEVAYRHNNVNNVCTAGGCSSTSASLWELSEMVNVLYDFQLGGNWSASVGAGIGGNLVTWRNSVSFDDYVFAGQLIAEVGYQFADRWQAFASYRYVMMSDPNFSPNVEGLSEDAPISMEKRDHTLLIGVRFDLQADHVAPPPERHEPPPEPKRPRQFIVFFGFNKSNLSAEAERVVHEAAAAAHQFGSAQIIVVGHTDTVGSNSYNMRLSLRRAAVVKAELVEDGIKRDMIEASGKGETELMVQTGDGVKEPQNRRATIDLH